MAKKALIIKAAAKPKFAVRGYTRCQRCGRPQVGLPQVRPVPDLPPGDGPPRRAARRHQGFLVRHRAAQPTDRQVLLFAVGPGPSAGNRGEKGDEHP